MDSTKRRRKPLDSNGEHNESVEVKFIESRLNEMERERTDLFRENDKLRKDLSWYKNKVSEVERNLVHAESKHDKLKCIKL